MEQNQLATKRHSLAHVLAMAVKERFPGVHFGVGPAVENGFYYDIDLPAGVTLSAEDLPTLTERMRALIKTPLTFTRKEVSPDEARALFADEPYKLELINEYASEGRTLSVYESGTFVDLCEGPHVETTSLIDPESFTLSSVAGAYWRGSEKNPMLTRIYGFAFDTKAELDAHLSFIEEAKKRDHRILGKEMDIFTFDDEVGPGLPLWLPNGTVLIDQLEKLAKEAEDAQGYQRVRTPHIAQDKLYLRSGHLPYYEESMYPPMEYDGGKYYLKAMNCPHHHKIFGARPHSYRDLPMRLAEYGTCYRHEQSGELFGLMRVRSMQMNDAHIYCTEEQFFDEFKSVIELYLRYFEVFGIEKYVMRLSKHSVDKLGKKYVNEPELWIKTEDMVRKTLVDLNVPFVEAEDEAAFYGPKIDVQIWSAIGREFTLATNQVDFAVPARFNLVYTDTDGKEKTPLCIHRAPLSTHERIIGFLIEHYAGNFPLWLAPEQVRIIPIGEGHRAHATVVYNALNALGIRTKLDADNETLGKRIRSAKTSKVPYTIVIGDAEVTNNSVTLESRDKGKVGELSVDALLARLTEEIETRKQ